MANCGTIRENGKPPNKTQEVYLSRKMILKNALEMLVGFALRENNNQSVQKAVAAKHYCLCFELKPVPDEQLS